ncbi:hypothetical protein ABK046_50845, partial [Streptomyces caeruleatus]
PAHAKLLCVRLASLEGNSVEDLIDLLDQSLNAVQTAENAVAAAKIQTKMVAAALWREAKRKYSIAELQEATGHDEE